MKCEHCGAELEKGAKTCPSCGAKVTMGDKAEAGTVSAATKTGAAAGKIGRTIVDSAKGMAAGAKKGYHKDADAKTESETPKESS
jgi:DNA-directed RNA polymerase subunit RPC12/RpoP